jgi:ATP-dependent HslUV protease ATP-binding subunit HslU
MMERLLDQVSFDAPEMGGREVVIDAAYVRERLNAILQDQYLSRYVL